MPEQVAAPGPHTSVDPRVEARLNAAGRVIRWLATIYAFVCLLGVVLPPLQDIPPGPSLIRETPAASAIGLTVFAVGALLAGDVSNTVASNVTWRRLGVVMCLGAAVFGLVILGLILVGRSDVWGPATAAPSPSTGLILTVLGSSVPLIVSRFESRVMAGQAGALLVFSITAVIFLGYMYGEPSVGALVLRPQISLQASLIAVISSIGVFLGRPASGLLSTASSPGAGGRLLRGFGPIVLLMPALLLFLVQTLPSTERVDALAIVAVGLGLFLLTLLSFFVRALDETAIEAATQAAHAERARAGLRQEAPVVSRMAGMLHFVDVGDVDGWEVATRFRPGRGSVAGDASAVHWLPDGRVGAVVVDLTGHGADPAVWAIRMRDLLLQSLVAGKSPAEAMQIVHWSAPGDVLASALVMRLDPESGDVSMCSAGHPPVIVVGVQDVELKPPTGPLLYLDHDSSYEEHHFKMAGGEAVVIFSDGIADVQVARHGRTEPETLADLLLAEGGLAARTADLVLGFADGERGDDQTVVVIRRSP